MFSPSSSAPAATRGPGPSGITETTDAERQLARQLDELLATRPQHKRTNPAGRKLDLAQAPPAAVTDTQAEGIFANDAADDFEWTGLVGPERENDPARRSAGTGQWLKSARRERTKDRLRNTAAWAVTGLIGGAIVSVAAYVLLGGWPGYEHLVLLGERVIQ